MCSNVFWHTTHFQAAFFSSLTCLFPFLHNILFMQPLPRLCSSKFIPTFFMWQTGSGVLWCYYPTNIFFSPFNSPLTFFLSYFNPLSILPNLPFSLSSALVFLFSLWHMFSWLMLASSSSAFSAFQLDSIEWLEPLLSCCCGCWLRLFLKGLLQLVFPFWVSLVPNPHYLTKLLSVRRPHVSGTKPLFKTQVLPRRQCSSNSEGTMKEGVGSYSVARKDME